MSTFPPTSVSLIAKIRDLPPGEDGAAWARFWELYSPAMRAFAVFKGGAANADDIVMTVFGKLVEVLRSGQFDQTKGSFHSYLATMIYNEVHMQYRKDEVRKSDAHVPLDEALAESLEAPPSEEVDADWQRAVLQTAVLDRRDGREVPLDAEPGQPDQVAHRKTHCCNRPRNGHSRRTVVAATRNEIF